MSDKKPIYSIAKDLGIDSNKIVLACNHLGIYAKGASKRLDKEELERIISYFKTGKNVANEIVEIDNNLTLNEKKVIKKISSNKQPEKNYFPNRLIG